MFKCPFGFLRLSFIYSCVGVYFRCFYIFLLMIALDEILVKIPVSLGTRQFFELLEDSVGMTLCLIFLPYLFYGFPVGFSPLFIIFRAPSAWWPSSFLFRLLEPVGLQLCWLVAPFNGRQSLKTVSFFGFGLGDCHLCRSFGLKVLSIWW